jgi:hypothetical protein
MTTLGIRLSDLFRATLADGCGSEGFIGISPEGSQYHVVVPVDRQMARGLKFWAQPADGTPFGGYVGWHYFVCLTYPDIPENHEGDHEARLGQARENGWLIRKQAGAMGLEIHVVDDMRTTREDMP